MLKSQKQAETFLGKHGGVVRKPKGPFQTELRKMFTGPLRDFDIPALFRAVERPADQVGGSDALFLCQWMGTR